MSAESSQVSVHDAVVVDADFARIYRFPDRRIDAADIAARRDDGLVNCAACWDASVPPEDNIEISGPHVLMLGTR